MRSQVQAFGGPAIITWDDYENGCLSTYAGGHHTDGHLDAFQHGMSTVFNLLRHEFPPAEQCKASPRLLEEGKKLVAWLIRLAENAEKQAVMPNQFETMIAAYTADAKNYRASAKGMQAAIAEAETTP